MILITKWQGVVFSQILKHKLNPLNIHSVRELGTNSSSKNIYKIGVQGAGFGGGQPKQGLLSGPEFIRKSGFQQFLIDEIGHDIIDYGDIDFKDCNDRTKSIKLEGSLPINNVEGGSKANFKIYEATKKLIKEGRVPLTLGGDHCISIGTLNGVTESYEDVGVLWVDAHADLNTPYTTLTGNLHGLPMAFHLKELEQEFKKLPHFDWVKPRVPARNLAYIGLREIGGRHNPKPQRDNIKRLGIKYFTMKEVDERGIIDVTKEALDHITENGKRPVHLSFDVDVMDDLEVGGFTGTAVSGGLSLREGCALLEQLSGVKLVSADFVEVNPSMGDGVGDIKKVERMQDVCKHLLGAMFGYTRYGMQ